MQDAPENSLHPMTRAEWRSRHDQNHSRTEAVWLVSYKQVIGKPRVEYGAQVEEALCFGWIDSKANTLDERSVQWFSPRMPRTGWSKLNKERIERMVAVGLMTATGDAKIDNRERGSLVDRA